MRRPSFLEGVSVAFVLAMTASVGLLALSTLMTGPLLLRGLIMCVAALYVIYLLARSRHRGGRLAASAAWLIAAVATWFLAPTFLWFAAAHVGLIWLVRTMFYHERFLTAAADMGLGVISFAAAIATAEQTGSLFLAVWSFFLLQALFVLCMHVSHKQSDKFALPPGDDFDKAARTADSALRRLSV